LFDIEWIIKPDAREENIVILNALKNLSIYSELFKI